MDMTMKGWQRMLEKVVGQIDVPEGEVQASGRTARGCGSSALSMPVWITLASILKSRPLDSSLGDTLRARFHGNNGYAEVTPRLDRLVSLAHDQRRILQRRMFRLQHHTILQRGTFGPSRGLCVTTQCGVRNTLTLALSHRGRGDWIHPLAALGIRVVERPFE